MEAAHHGDGAGAQQGGGKGGGEGLWDELLVGNQLRHRLMASPVPAVRRQRQQGAVRACEDEQRKRGISNKEEEEEKETFREGGRARVGTVAVGWMLSQDGLTLPSLPPI